MPDGHVTIARFCTPAELVTVADWMLHAALRFAHTAYALNDVAAPLALFTSALHVVDELGNELLTLAAVLPELTNTPPPYTTRPDGQVAVARVCVPVGAVSDPDVAIV